MDILTRAGSACSTPPQPAPSPAPWRFAIDLRGSTAKAWSRKKARKAAPSCSRNSTPTILYISPNVRKSLRQCDLTRTVKENGAHMANSENGWPLVGESNLQALPWLPNNARLLAGPVTTVLGYVAKQFEARVEHITSTSTYRPNAIISGTSTYSNHASATAIDFNGGKHPMGASGTFTPAQVVAIRAILAECSGVLRWGGDYTGRKDEMHFEIRPGATAAQVEAAAKRVDPAPPTPGSQEVPLFTIDQITRGTWLVRPDGSWAHLTPTEWANIKAALVDPGIIKHRQLGPDTIGLTAFDVTKNAFLRRGD